jgi:hypothetical protein
MLVVVGLVAWFWTQRILGQRQWPRVESATAFTNGQPAGTAARTSHPRATNRFLIVSSAIIDARGLFLLSPRPRRLKG